MKEIADKIKPSEILDDSTLILGVYMRKWKGNKCHHAFIGKVYVAPESYYVNQIRVYTYGKNPQPYTYLLDRIKADLEAEGEGYFVDENTKITVVHNCTVTTYRTIKRNRLIN